MNEQPQPDDGSHNTQGGEPLYRTEKDGHSAFSGFDLAGQQTPSASVPPAAPPMPVPPADDAKPLLSWEASEYIHHTKSFTWFLAYGLVMLLLLAVAYFLTHAWTFVVLVVVMTVAGAIYARRPPRTLHYSLNAHGVSVDQRFYPYSDFRAFGILADGAFYSIMLIPTKRFRMAVSVYFAEPDGEKIVDILGARLPMEDLHLDAIDQLMRRVRF